MSFKSHFLNPSTVFNKDLDRRREIDLEKLFDDLYF